MMKVIGLFLTLLCLSEAYRILVVFPVPSKSHSILGHGVVNHLLDAGHEVVHVTSYPHGKTVKNLKEVDLTSIADYFTALKDSTDEFKLKNRVGDRRGGTSILIYYLMYEMNKKILTDPTLVKFLEDPKEKFDAVITEWFFYENVAGIASLFDCPLIWFATTEASWNVVRLVDELPNPSYNVDIFSTSKPPLDFWERVQELCTVVWRSLQLSVVFTPLEKSVYNSVFNEIAAKRGVTIPSYDQVVYNASFLFINSHPSFGGAYRLPQNAKYVGGFHVETKTKPLPKDLQTLMDGAKDGVIYFSMGSNLNSEDMSEHMITSILKMFGKLKQTVLWKFQTQSDRVPSNVHLIKWAPQQSILAHPNLKMFITHGGQLSTIEAIHHGVPVVGIPVIADQHVNMASVVDKGFGIVVDLGEDMADDMEVAIKKILGDNSYALKAKELSQLYHDRRNPGEEMVYWIEHVIRTKGALHLRSPALSLPFYKRFYLDLVVLIFVLIGSIIAIQKLINKFKSKKQIKTKKN
ncbi:UDP-glucosyltransferase 2-like [Aricia agestis]|uniref:UDP-glucosyltransferase 2-like n=1 Tax=Aricia agestis TaxID=91739 RepID=UPI001C2057D8|nr:UDP-glucosyltransferase 2-like [Aricia agestis]